MKICMLGRPNVGKTTLFNRLTGQRAIISDIPETTYDFLEAPILGTSYILVDFPGFQGEITPFFANWIAQCSLILFMIDAKYGLLPLDETVFRSLKNQFPSIPVVLVVNKVEKKIDIQNVHTVYPLGVKVVIPISAKGSEGISALKDTIQNMLQGKTTKTKTTEIENTEINNKIVFMGRPNSGKSSLLNCILGKERVRVSDIPGTTRDSVTDTYVFAHTHIGLTDTAGLNKKHSRSNQEQAWDKSTMRVLRNATVACVVMDITRSYDGYTLYDRETLRIIHQIFKSGVSLVVAVNKVDTVPNFGSYVRELEAQLHNFIGEIFVIPVSAKTQYGVPRLLKTLIQVGKLSQKRISTGQLNRWFHKLIEQRPPRASKVINPKLKYITQVEVNPPFFVITGHNIVRLDESYMKYIIHQLQKDFFAGGIPVKLTVKGNKTVKKI